MREIQSDPRSSSSAWKWWVCGLLLLATMINYMDRLTINDRQAHQGRSTHQQRTVRRDRTSLRDRVCLGLACLRLDRRSLECALGLPGRSAGLVRSWLPDRLCAVFL